MPMLRLFSLFFFLSVTFLHVGPAQAAPKPDPWPVWEKHDPESTAKISHIVWQNILDRYLKPQETGPNLFDYASLNLKDKRALAGYIRALESTPISSFNRTEQFAYWLNFYNALTIKVILDHWPTKTILDVDLGGAFFSNGPWDKKLVSVEGTELSLNDIEHRILRPGWKDPRVHYGVNCASIGCPNLMATAFNADNVDNLLTQGAKTYINSPRGVKLTEDGKLVMSKIYDWFEVDFGGSESGVIKHVLHYADQDLAQKLEGRSDIDDFEYDWGGQLSFKIVPENRPPPSISLTMKTKKLKAWHFGRHGEALACLLLRLKGYRILERNKKIGGVEVDIIAHKAKTLCFIEVKSRKTRSQALEAISYFQQKRIVRAARSFLSANPRYCEGSIRFDLIAISSNRWPVHIKNAWFDDL
jgi:Holliday junction resolvase-like predicted endonuclease